LSAESQLAKEDRPLRIQFDRDRRYVTATGTQTQPVQTILVQPEKQDKGVSKRRQTQ